MSSRFLIQLYRGTTAQNDAYTGADGEITVDITTKQLRLHDGSTQGGFPIPNVNDTLTPEQIETLVGGELAELDGDVINHLKEKADLNGNINEDFSANTLTVNHITPNGSNVTIGSQASRFKAIYVDEAYLSTNTLYIGDTPIMGTEQDTVVIKADPGQSISMVTQGSGRTLLESSRGIDISTNSLNADIQMDAIGSGSKVRVGAQQGIDFTAPDTTVYGNLSTTGDYQVGGDLTISGDLTVNGERTVVNTQTVQVTDNLMYLNHGQSGSGVSAQYAGIEIDRGNLSSYQFVFDEATDLFKIGMVGDLEAVSTREWVQEYFSGVSHGHAVATTTSSGFMSADDKSKLNGIAAGAQVNVATNLGSSRSGSSYTITSSTGSNTTLSAATTSNAGVMSATDKTKLEGIEAGAEVNTVNTVAGRTGDVTVSASDVGLGNVRNVSSHSQSEANSLFAPQTRTVTAGDGLSGGGNLSGNRTLSVDSTVVRTSGNQTIGGDKTFTGVIKTSGQAGTPDSNAVIRTGFVGTAGEDNVHVNLQGVSRNGTDNENGGAFIRFATSTSGDYGVYMGGRRRSGGDSSFVIKTGGQSPTDSMVVDESGNVIAVQGEFQGDGSGLTGTASLRATGTTKGDVGLGNVDNTSDANKPISTATQGALDTKVDKESGKGLSTNDFTNAYQSKLNGIEAGAEVNTVTSVAGRTGAVTLSRSDVGLSNVDNTSDANKPVSNATQSALDLKVDISNIVDSLTSSASNLPLSAAQGKVLKTYIDNIHALLDSDEPALDTLQEIVDFIQLNKASLESLDVGAIAGLQTKLDNLQGDINTKVDKVLGKGLSEEDFTTTLRNKLNGIEAGAEVNVPTNLGLTGSGNSRTLTSSTGSNTSLPVATTSTAGLMATGDKSKLDGIEAGAEVNVATNLGNTRNSTSVTVTSSTGSNTTLNAATTSNAGVMVAADKSKLDGIEAGAEVNTVTSVAGRTGAVTLSHSDISGLSDAATTTVAAIRSGTTKANVGLSNVRNVASYSQTEGDGRYVLKSGDSVPTLDDLESISFINGVVRVSASTTTESTATATLTAFDTSTFGSAEIALQASVGNQRHLTKLLVVHDDTDAFSTEYGGLTTHDDLFAVEVSVSGGEVLVQVTPTTSSSVNFRATVDLFEV